MAAQDTLLIEGIEFIGHHGYYPRERRDGCRFRVDLQVHFDARPAARSDVLEDTVSYDDLASLIVSIGEGETVILVERLAEDMCAALLERFPVSEVDLTLRKLSPRVPGNPTAVGLRIRRSKA
ncbi:MAG: dihydroneopterin aldolase [Bradymonadia bacterium]